MAVGQLPASHRGSYLCHVLQNTRIASARSDKGQELFLLGLQPSSLSLLTVPFPNRAILTFLSCIKTAHCLLVHRLSFTPSFGNSNSSLRNICKSRSNLKPLHLIYLPLCNPEPFNAVLMVVISPKSPKAQNRSPNPRTNMLF